MTALPTALLDVDGTLVDSNFAHAQAWEAALAEFGFNVPAGFLVRLIGMGGDKILPLISPKLSDDKTLGKHVVARRKAILFERYLPALRPTLGARALVERLRDAGIVCVVASSAARDELDALLKVAGVTDLIDHLTSSDDAERSKPSPDIITAALEKAGRPPHDAVLIGDTPYDVLAAANAGVPTVAFRSGGWEDAALANAIAIYDNPADLLAHFAASPLGRWG